MQQQTKDLTCLTKKWKEFKLTKLKQDKDSNHYILYAHVTISGLPKQDDNYAYYNEQEYKDDYDYGDDEAPVNDVDGASDNSVPIHRPIIISESIEEEVDNGMTIRLPCIVDKLPGEN